MIKKKKRTIPKKKLIRAAHWKRPTTMATEKYKAVSKAILTVLGQKGMRWSELVGRVEKKLPKFQGAVWYYTTQCLRELETQGKVRRVLGSPVLYSKR